MTYLKHAPRATALWVGAIAISLGFSGVALAQDLEEIVVTAQKREQNLKDVPIAITALSSDVVDDLRILKPGDLADAVPGLSIGGTGAGETPTFNIRGLGFGGGSIGAQAVSVNIDEVSFSNGLMATGQTFDIERIEVLKGPQGDLYGRNTTGGAINFVSKKPHADKEVMLQIGYGNQETVETKGVLNGALSETVNARFAWQSIDRGEGWQTNWQTGEDHGQFSQFSGRLSLDWAASDAVTVLVNVHGYKDDSDTVASAAVGPVGSFPDSLYPGSISPNPSNPFLVNWEVDPDFATTNCNFGATQCRDWGGKPSVKHDSFGGFVRIDWDINDTYALTSLSAYEELERSRIIDGDGSNVSIYDEFAQYDLDMFTQEVRLTANPTDKVSWLAGVFYGTDFAEEKRDFEAGEYYWNAGLFPFMARTGFKQDTDTSGIFAHAEFAFSDQLTLVTGLRYTKEDKSIRDAGAINRGDMSSLIFDTVFGLGPDSANWPACWEGYTDGGILTSNFLNSLVGVPFCAVPADFNKDSSDSGTSGKLVLVYQPNDNHTTYLSFSRGFKSGGFNSGNLVASQDFTIYTPETVNAYEFGWKGVMANGRFGSNFAAYFYDYEDRQTGASVWDPVFGTAGTTVNRPQAENYGAELELNFQVTESLNWYFGGSYIHAKQLEFVGYDVGTANAMGQICDFDGQNPDPINPGGFQCNVVADFSGQRLAVRPWHFVTRLSHEWDVGSMSLRAALDYSKRADTPITQNSTTTSPGWGQFGLNFSLRDDDGRWSVDLWGRNVTDKIVVGTGSTNAVDNTTIQNLPREYGIRGTMYWQ